MVTVKLMLQARTEFSCEAHTDYSTVNQCSTAMVVWKCFLKIFTTSWAMKMVPPCFGL